MKSDILPTRIIWGVLTADAGQGCLQLDLKATGVLCCVCTSLVHLFSNACRFVLIS